MNELPQVLFTNVQSIGLRDLSRHRYTASRLPDWHSHAGLPPKALVTAVVAADALTELESEGTMPAAANMGSTLYFWRRDRVDLKKSNWVANWDRLAAQVPCFSYSCDQNALFGPS